ncbi:MAG TPA: MraY family glycosyltransferase [Candidatus Omnitrophota bacterium]|nr:MraY family glycosyltransferase [Candidatus Omnitrophota bacterium]
MDNPGGRKVHLQATPLLGGVGIYLGLVIGLMVSSTDMGPFLPVMAGATLILAVGLVEDIRGLSAQIRLIFQLLAATIIVGSGIKVSFLPNVVWGDIAEILVTVIWLVGVTSAFNYLDGLDGLASGSAVINLAAFSVILYSTGQYALGKLCIILIAACLGFLPHNFRIHQKMFLGEAGSTLLGFMLASIALVGNWAEDNTVKLFIPILIIAVPIFDMIFTTIMRVREGKVKTVVQWLRYGGRDHFHHYLVSLGLPNVGAVIFIYFVSISLGIAAYMVSNDKAIEGLLALTQTAITFCVIAILILAQRRNFQP